MNNNRNNNNNRRRGRGNRQQGGGNQNRIDSRARGNAPQLLEKYKKLAQDAAHNGDRVQAEYFLQFADHYFRVIADNKARQDEARGGAVRRDSDDDGYEGEDEFDTPRYGQRDNRDGRERDGRDREARDRDARDRDARDGRGRDNRRQRGSADQATAVDEGEPGYEGDMRPASDNPFSRDSRPRAERGDWGDTRRQPRRNSRNEGQVEDAAPAPIETGFDAAVLPPSIAVVAPVDDAEDTPKKPVTRRRRKPADEAGDGSEQMKVAG